MKRACREAFAATLLGCAQIDRDIIVVTTDSRGSSLLGKYAQVLPDQFVETGIAEQNAVGIAAGLASCGKKTFVCGPASFYSTRSLEQIKNDVAYTGTNVKIICVSGGVAYGALGSTHHSLHDIAVFRAIPGISIIIPSDARQTETAIKYLSETDGAVYMRFGRAAVPDIYGETAEDHTTFRFGKGNVLKDGTDVTIAACGQMVYYALQAAEALSAEGISARVLDLPTVKPLDEKLVHAAAAETGAIITVEEHSIYGGLGGAVAEVCGSVCPVPLTILGIPDEPAFTGSQLEVFDHYGLNASGIAVAAKTLLARKL